MFVKFGIKEKRTVRDGYVMLSVYGYQMPDTFCNLRRDCIAEWFKHDHCCKTWDDAKNRHGIKPVKARMVIELI